MDGKIILKQARIGKINFVNTAPFYHGLFNPAEDVRIVEGSPVEMNTLMFNDRLDLAPISSLEYALHSDKYYLFPDLCIGARDFSRSVLLFSRERIEGLDKETIMLSRKSLSSVTLLKLLFKYKYQFQNKFVVSQDGPDAMLGQSKAALVIGDEALFYKSKEFLYKYDLSELWWDWMKLPFCFSVWAVRRSFYDEHSKEVFDFHERLKQNTNKNLLDLETLIKDGLNITIADQNFAPVFGYLFNLNYFFDQEMIKGLESFYSLSAKEGFTPPVDEIHFLETPS